MNFQDFLSKNLLPQNVPTFSSGFVNDSSHHGLSVAPLIDLEGDVISLPTRSADPDAITRDISPADVLEFFETQQDAFVIPQGQENRNQDDRDYIKATPLGLDDDDDFIFVVPFPIMKAKVVSVEKVIYKDRIIEVPSPQIPLEDNAAVRTYITEVRRAYDSNTCNVIRNLISGFQHPPMSEGGFLYLNTQSEGWIKIFPISNN